MKIEVSSRGVNPASILIDGGGLLYKVHWPTGGAVSDLVDGIERYIRKMLTSSDVYIIFDRYKDGSIKSGTRDARIGSFQRFYQLTLTRDLPPKEICLSSIKTKENLFEIISQELCKRFVVNTTANRLVINAGNPVPEEVQLGVQISRTDLASLYEESDYMIPQQIAAIVSADEKAVVTVLSAVTDVFVLLCFHLWKCKWHSIKLHMDTFSDGKDKLISINNTVEVHKLEIPSLIGLHALSGCDTVPMMFGIGKSKAMKSVRDAPLILLGEKDADIEEVMQEAFAFVSRCYGQYNHGSSENRQTIWKRKTDSARKSAKPTALKSLPPTDDALRENIKRAHFTAALWKNCLSGNLPPNEPL